jgi:hypothetical protein
MSQGSHFNRHGRRSGGNRPIIVNITGPGTELPSLSIQCFERRHGDCEGHNTLFNCPCDCTCHQKMTPTKEFRKRGIGSEACELHL